MYIDNENIEKYGAKLVEYTVGGTMLENNNLSGKLSILYFSQRPKCKRLSITLTFEAGTRGAVTERVSSLTAILLGQHEIGMPDGFTYTAILNDDGIGETGQLIDNWFEVTYQFTSIQHKELETVILSTPGNFFAGGTAETYCIYELSPDKTIEDFTVNGIRIRNLIGGKKFVINGIYKKVLEDGGNAFQKATLIDFPTVHPGINEFSMSARVPIKIMYYPTYV